MPEENPFDRHHVIPITYDEKGYPCAEAPFTPESDKVRCAVVVPPDKAIPVILVPGIMGSNLKLKSLPRELAEKRVITGKVKRGHWWQAGKTEQETEPWGDLAWHPDDASTFMVNRFWLLKAHERRALLNPTNTEVDDRAPVKKDAAKGFAFESPLDGKEKGQNAERRRQAFLNEMKRRGWSSVVQDFYLPLLAFLELNLNQLYYLGNISDFSKNLIKASQSKAPWGMIKGARELTEDDVTKASRYWYPVHAVGYNWTQSNGDSAQYLLERIREITERFRNMGWDCEKVILVTHSMGGLVARAAAHPELGRTDDNAAERILGVIHGVMPTHGAAAAYRRCHAGFEKGGVVDVAASILGSDGPEVAAIFSNSPGALQLLPSRLYGPGWLRIRMPNGSETVLPAADPYTEIYQKKEPWWRLMNPDWVDPTPGLATKKKEDAWERYLRTLEVARAFHENLGASHHAHTCVQYAEDDKEHKAFGAVRWGTPPSVVSVNPMELGSRESTSGEVEVLDPVPTHRPVVARYSLSGQDEAGDGTVPVRSARGINDTVEMVAAHSPGYDHSESYKKPQVQELTAYAIVRMVAEYMS